MCQESKIAWANNDMHSKRAENMIISTLISMNLLILQGL